MKASERAPAASVPSKEHLSSSLLAGRIAYLFATRSPHKRRGVGIDAPPAPFSELCACSPSQELLSNKETGERNNGRFPKKAPQKNGKTEKPVFYLLFTGEATPKERPLPGRGQSVQTGAAGASVLCRLYPYHCPRRSRITLWHRRRAPRLRPVGNRNFDDFVRLVPCFGPTFVRWSVCLSLPFPNRCR